MDKEKLLVNTRLIDQTKRLYFEAVSDLYKNENYEEAFDLWEALLRIDPDNRNIHNKLQEIIESG